MTWEPISGDLQQYAASASAQAAGYVLKFYETGGTTPLTVSSSSTGSPTTTDFLLDSAGYFTLSSTRVIPHVQTAYKLIMYLNQTDADADATGSAVWTIDNITLGSDITSLGPTIAQYASNGDYFLDSGAADAYILTVISAKQASAAYVDGEVCTFLPDNTSLTTSPTLNRDGIGNKNILDEDGNALVAGDIVASEMFSCRYNLAEGEFRRSPTVTLATKKDLKSGRKNKVINGDFLTNQDGLSFTPTATQYTSDMWVYNVVLSGGTLGSAGQTITPFTMGQADVPGTPVNYINMAGSISGGSGSEQLSQVTKIEDVRSLTGIVTLSFWIKASTSGTVEHHMVQDFGTGGSPSAGVIPYTPVDIAVTTSWQQITKTFTMSSLSSKVRGSNNDDFLAFVIGKQLGATAQSALGAPTAVNFSGTIDISDVQISEASYDTDYDRLTVGDSLSACERYYQILDLGGNNPLIGRNNSGTMISNRIAYPTVMRAGPTVTATGGTVTFNVLDTGSSASSGAATSTSVSTKSLAVAVASVGGTSGSFYGMTWAGVAEVFNLDARL